MNWLKHFVSLLIIKFYLLLRGDNWISSRLRSSDCIISYDFLSIHAFMDIISEHSIFIVTCASICLSICMSVCLIPQFLSVQVFPSNVPITFLSLALLVNAYNYMLNVYGQQHNTKMSSVIFVLFIILF